MPFVLNATRQTATVLLIDDEASVRTLFGSVLRVLGCRVLEAPNGERALRMLADGQEAVSLIFLDWRMPVMGGADFCDAYHAAAGDNAVPIVAICSNTDDVGPHRGVVKQVLGKPISIHDIVDIVEGALSGAGWTPRGLDGLPPAPERD